LSIPLFFFRRPLNPSQLEEGLVFLLPPPGETLFPRFFHFPLSPNQKGGERGFFRRGQISSLLQANRGRGSLLGRENVAVGRTLFPVDPFFFYLIRGYPSAGAAKPRVSRPLPGAPPLNSDVERGGQWVPFFFLLTLSYPVEISSPYVLST